MIYPVLFFFAVWLVILTLFVIRANSKWSKITKDAKSINLVQILENILEKQDKNDKQNTAISQFLANLEEKSKTKFQKSALVRFNPFEDTGGDQSFIIALLNGNNDGFVMSSLHSRNSTRVYAKLVEAGKATDHQFSKEEKEVVEKAART